MKNLFLITTTEESNTHLWHSGTEKILSTCEKEYSNTRETVFVYITNNDEITQYDWYVNTKNRIYINRCGSTIFKGLYENCKKIILTNNPNYKNVQQLTEEELELLVNNFSDSVEVVRMLRTNSGLGFGEYAILDSNFKATEINTWIDQSSYEIGKTTILEPYEYNSIFSLVFPKKNKTE